MDNFVDGSVVICSTSQAGTLVQITGKEVWVLLTNGDIWVGAMHQIRTPQDQADLDSCPLNVDRLVDRVVPKFTIKERD